MKIRAQLEEATTNKMEEISAKRKREKIKEMKKMRRGSKNLFY